MKVWAQNRGVHHTGEGTTPGEIQQFSGIECVHDAVQWLAVTLLEPERRPADEQIRCTTSPFILRPFQELCRVRSRGH